MNRISLKQEIIESLAIVMVMAIILKVFFANQVTGYLFVMLFLISALVVTLTELALSIIYYHFYPKEVNK